MTDTAYTSLQAPIDVDNTSTIISINELRDTIALKKLENEKMLIQQWRDTLTMDYIKQKMIEAELKGEKSASLLKVHGYDAKYLKRVFLNAALQNELCSMVEPPAYFGIDTCVYFDLYVRWDEPQTCCTVI